VEIISVAGIQEQLNCTGLAQDFYGVAVKMSTEAVVA
jgi:hypothetical protein